MQRGREACGEESGTAGDLARPGPAASLGSAERGRRERPPAAGLAGSCSPGRGLLGAVVRGKAVGASLGAGCGHGWAGGAAPVGSWAAPPGSGCLSQCWGGGGRREAAFPSSRLSRAAGWSGARGSA